MADSQQRSDLTQQQWEIVQSKPRTVYNKASTVLLLAINQRTPPLVNIPITRYDMDGACLGDALPAQVRIEHQELGNAVERRGGCNL
ncbi:hypothetical protein NDU88_007277 [Pleurodeles waltl]|uniref:Uncharacterized protein n=1 Tax=Pleurodeles waltl TaxID=8319 RepID=A0AAV7TZJ6_PLEWA|nr:hypothetical protein NDU88_007277 [Pleurodeles waltl]